MARERCNTPNPQAPPNVVRINENIFFDQAPFPMAVVNVNGRFLKVNDAFPEVTGYSAAELCDMRWQDITHPEDLSGDEEMALRSASGQAKHGYGMVKRYIHKAGHSVWINLRVRPVFKDEGGFDYFAVFAVPLPNHGRYEVSKAKGDTDVIIKPVVNWLDVARANPKQAIAIAIAIAILSKSIPVSLFEAVGKLLK